MDNTEWLASLKPGDEVAITRGGYRGGYDLARVERRTPTGRIVVCGFRNQFNPSGSEMGDRSVWNGHRRLCPVTDDVRATVRREADLLKLDEAHRIADKLTDEQLHAIAEAIRVALSGEVGAGKEAGR